MHGWVRVRSGGQLGPGRIGRVLLGLVLDVRVEFGSSKAGAGPKRKAGEAGDEQGGSSSDRATKLPLPGLNARARAGLGQAGGRAKAKGGNEVQIRPYKPEDETGWLRCRVLAFLDSAYYDNVYTSKETYENPAIQLVAEADGQIVGLLDVEYEQEPGQVAFACDADPRDDLGAVSHHVAIHPDYRRRGVGGRLLTTALEQLRDAGIGYVEAWTREDETACRWYESQRFRSIFSYLHVYLDGPGEMDGVLKSELSGLRPRYVFAHYVGDDEDGVRRRFRRIHKCQLYRRAVGAAGF